MSDGEELVDESEQDGESKADDPSADSRNGRRRIIVIIHNSANFGIRTVVGDQGCLKLHLVDKVLVLLGIVENSIVGCGCGSARPDAPTMHL